MLAVAAGAGLERLFAELGAHVVPGGETLNPSTYELLAGIHEVPAEEVLVLPSSSNVIMAAERACELSEKPARVVPATSQQASLLALVELDPAGSRRPRTPSGSRRRWRRSPPAASRPAARDDAQGRFRAGRRGRLRRRRDRRLGRRRLDPGGDDRACSPRDAEIVTVIAGDGAPIPLDEVDAHVPEGVELETHEGGQPSWWWLLAAQ